MQILSGEIIILVSLLTSTNALIASTELYNPYVLRFNDQIYGASFYKFMVNHKLALVLFDVPWCSKCQKLRLYFKRAAVELYKTDPSIALVHLDCNAHYQHFCLELLVTEYPSLKVFRYGEYVHDYKGQHNHLDIIEYMMNLIQSPYRELKSIDELDQLLLNGGKSPIVIGYFAKPTAFQLDLKLAFFDVAYYFPDVIFTHSTSNELVDKLGAKDRIILYHAPYTKNPFEPASIVYKGLANKTHLLQFIQVNMHGLVAVRTLKNQHRFTYPLVVTYYEFKNPKQSGYWYNRVIQVAKNFSGEIKFAVSCIYNFSHEISLDDGIPFNYPYNAIILNKTGDKVRMNQKFSIETLSIFIQMFLDLPAQKSLPIPRTQTGPVRELVAQNIKQFIQSSKNSILLAFYDSSSKFWKEFKPIYQEVAWRLQDEEVNIAKIDAVKNFVSEEYNVKNLPTLYWIFRDTGYGLIQYKGKLDFRSIIKFIARLTPVELKGWDRSGYLKNKMEL